MEPFITGSAIIGTYDDVLGGTMKRALDHSALESSDKSRKAEDHAHPGLTRLIHFVWAGGDENMPKSSIEVVTLWAEANPSFDVIIWVDAWDKDKELFSEKKLGKILLHYQERFMLHGINVFLNDIPHEYNKDAKAPIIIRDITQYQMVNKPIRYEIDKVIPNYGSSSDILRYRILYNYGGVYIDSDVSPGQDSLLTCPLFSEAYEGHRLYLDHVSQKSALPPSASRYLNFFTPLPWMREP
jgi:hypothetical protein